MHGHDLTINSKLKKNNYRKEYNYMNGCAENSETISSVTFHALN